MSVMSAIVGFKGFPSQDLQNPIGSVQVQERQAPLPVPKHLTPVSVASAHSAAARASGHVRSAARRHHGRASAPLAHANPVGQSGSTAADPQRSTTPAAPVKTPDAGNVVKDVTKVVPRAPSVPAPSGLLPALGLGSPDQGQAPAVQLPAVLTGVTTTVTNTVDKLLGH